MSLDDKRSIFAWAMYDWANSAYILTVATAVLPAFFVQGIVPEGGYELWGVKFAASSLWGLAVSFGAALVFVAAPVLGAVADRSGARKRFLGVFAMAGALAAFGVSFMGPGDVIGALVLFTLAQVSFACANVFYDSFLPHIASRGNLDRVSGLGFAYGYVGGGLQFALSLGVIALHGKLGLSLSGASHLAMASAAIWWAGFTILPLMVLEEPEAVGGGGLTVGEYLRLGAAKAVESVKSLARGGPASFFLIAYLLYNDGIQTVISMATIYGKEELGLSMSVLMLTLLAIQAVAFFGALAFSRLAGGLGTKRALMLAVGMWAGVTVYAYFMSGAVEYFILGGIIGLVLGGSQALSRSLFASLIPPEASAQYFGYFSVVAKLSAVGGPLVFALVRQTTGSSRAAILAIGFFFLAGMALLSAVQAGHKKS